MKHFFCCLALIFSYNICYGQTADFSFVGDNLNNLITTSNIAETSGYGQASTVYEKSLSYSYADHLPKNNDISPIYKQHPSLAPISIYFERRRLNTYYRDLEQWRSEEKKKLKRNKEYDREAIEFIYGR